VIYNRKYQAHIQAEAIAECSLFGLAYRGRSDGSAEWQMPVVFLSAKIEPGLRQRDAASFADRMTGDKRARTAADLGHIEQRCAQPTCGYTAAQRSRQALRNQFANE
jgi:hypothetical protein